MTTESVDWKAGLPDDLKADPSLTDIKDVSALAKAYRDTKAFVGAAIRVPGPDASDADRAEYREKLKKSAPGLVDLPAEEEKVVPALRAAGRLPKEAKEYEAPGVELTPEELTALQAEAAEEGLTKGAFAKRAARYAAAKAEGSKALKANEAELRKEFGAAFDDEMKGLRILAEKTGASQDVKDAIAANRITLGQARWLKSVGKSLGHETREIAGQDTPRTPKLTPSEIKARAREALNLANTSTDPEERREAWGRHIALQAMLEESGG